MSEDIRNVYDRLYFEIDDSERLLKGLVYLYYAVALEDTHTGEVLEYLEV